MNMQKGNNKKNSKWRKKLARKLFPLFAPLLLSPVVTAPVVSGYSRPEMKMSKRRSAEFSMMKYEQVVKQLYDEAELQKSGLDFDVFETAMTGYLNLKYDGDLSEKPLLTVIDFRKPSTKKRLWVVDLNEKKVLYHTYVAHGKNSGDLFARKFSNNEDSNMSSIGFYVTQETYFGKHGLSLKLSGMDEGVNTNALDRCIVIHGADYASQDVIRRTGRLGRSLGCPALPMEEHQEIIETIKENTCLYIHFPDKKYDSSYLDHAIAMTQLLKEEQPL